MMLSILIMIPFFCALCAFLPLTKQFRYKLFFVVSLIHATIVLLFWQHLPSPEFNGFLELDQLGLIVLSIISVLYLFVSVFMAGYFEHEQRSNRTVTACLLALLSTMTLASASRHMGLSWVAVETSTLFSAPLISFHRNQESLEATWKYLLICSVGIALALMGTFFLAIAAHDVHTLLLPTLLNNASSLSVNWLKLSVIFLLVGYGCKMGLAPTHSWKPEAYGQATGMVAVLMAGAVTQCSFLALMRVGQICSKTGLTDFYSSILILTGLLSLGVAAIFILSERNIKRAFAYSSIEHMGLLVLGLGLGGVGVFGAVFHMINNALAKVIMFLTAGSIAQKYGSSRVDEVRGVIHVYPVTGMFLIVALLAGTGMFPFATFHSELMILNAAVISKHYILCVFAVVCLGLMFIGMARIILDVVFGQPTQPVLAKKENFFMNFPIGIAALLLIGLGLWVPTFLEKVIRHAALLTGF
ncbi:MAG: hydrogenase [Candidatus Omnitrophica bacterium]|nr:hydrogenase [Candidatus Omnitrophota bacterium]